MKYILTVTSLFISLGASAQFSVDISWTKQSDMSADETVYYEVAEPLIWSDFRGKPVESGNTVALTTSGFGYRMNMGYTGTKGQLKIYVYCYFAKTRSWVKPGKKTDYVLAHEQKHFDISYLAADRFIKELKKARLTRENAGQKIQEAYDHCSQWMNDMQYEYDHQTRNGISRQDQEYWINKINKQISMVKE